MIHYQLRCEQDHSFDGWYKDSAAFEKLAGAGLIECPVCGGTKVARALMAPAIGKGREVEAPPPAAPAPEAGKATQAAAAGPMPAQVLALLQRMRSEVEKSCDYVGHEFADEARRIHRGESERRGIYGETSDTEAEALRDEGIEVARLPWVPRADS
ncbi:DUF1178 family protein [Roseomonas sp. E05]|uniref:DUF1178 family protein n=1 Tax=Roseomonas sp. E05 TaxID=3046310 RepID=UPI0024B955B3|nr:DUF1178 family protein [Roseomonas sp. E05]MDJ0390993.1 DUF1178 family protein [Roseomonas sp. E05]